MKPGNKESSKGTEKCNLFNNNFVSLFNKEVLDTTAETPEQNRSIQIEATSEAVCKLPDASKENKALVYDEIGNFVSRKCSHTFSLRLVMCQNCLYKVINPETRKIGKITPIPKEGIKADVTCCRSIGLLCCCSKVLAQLVLVAICEIVLQQVHASQYVFPRKRSATLQLVVFPDKLLIGVTIIRMMTTLYSFYISPKILKHLHMILC